MEGLGAGGEQGERVHSGLTKKRVLIIGGGIAGLSAARELARFDINVDLVEKSVFPGGHAIQYACKATDECVKCGACLVEDSLKEVVQEQRIHLFAGSQVEGITKGDRFSVKVFGRPHSIDPEKCVACGNCRDICPVEGAIVRGTSKNQKPFYAIDEALCLYHLDRSCDKCQDVCPEKAINLEEKGSRLLLASDAIIVATGFEAFDPKDKPYGAGRFENVITNLDLERMLRQEALVKRPSDEQEPKSMAFIQCVGSRDAKLNHLWCSKVCCPSALRMARLIKSRQSGIKITFFYIDIQTFGKDFDSFYHMLKSDIRMIRTIPGDIFEVEDKSLRLCYFDGGTEESREDLFDLVVLSVGIQPGRDNRDLADLLSVDLDDSGFFPGCESSVSGTWKGVFTAGTANGPMSIPETMNHALSTTFKVVKYLESGDC
ncbi:MAG: FAD-dependent oxidoreductase [Thermodesulfobacteriota bacterium]|nr:FAD-dependent oxidoreductase [Thermodesulfobacteriota bacterium]